MSRRKKRARVLRRSLLLALGIVLLFIVGLYVYFGFYFRSHFFYRTSIEDIDVGGMTAEEAVQELRLEVKDYLLVMQDRNGNKHQILGRDFDYDYQPMGEEEKLIEDQSSFLWPLHIAKDKKLDIDKSITYDEDLLRSCFVFGLFTGRSDGKAPKCIDTDDRRGIYACTGGDGKLSDTG